MLLLPAGRSPDWYKSFNYRVRAVKEPREVMREFGLEVGHDVEVAVHDSSADIRYMVLPMRPPGTEGLSEEELARLITRACLIGVNVPLEPRWASRVNYSPECYIHKARARERYEGVDPPYNEE